MATSPREELVITDIVVFGRFPEGWVWSQRNAQGDIVTDSSHKGFAELSEAIADFFEDEAVDLGETVEATKAHYSKPIHVGADEVHIRKYLHGAPDPLQAVTA